MSEIGARAALLSAADGRAAVSWGRGGGHAAPGTVSQTVGFGGGAGTSGCLLAILSSEVGHVSLKKGCFSIRTPVMYSRC